MAQSFHNPAQDFAPWADPQAKPLISFRGVTKRFGDFTAVDDLSLDIYEREFFALLGPSGCGKTTLMRMLAGFEQPSEGTITLGGEVLDRQPPNARPVNMMFQSYALFPHLSVAQNIAFGLKRDRLDTAEIAARTDEMLRLVQLTEFAKRKPDQLSGGQRQRVALARALAKRPKLLLLDEPLGALDKKLRQQTQFELMEIQERTGCTFMIVTHDQEEAMTVASRIAVMDKGKVVQAATPGEIYEAPINTYVAGFVGEVNMLKGIADGAPEPVVALEGGGAVRALWGATVPQKGPVTLVVRPEKCSISQTAPGPDSPERVNALDGTVIDIAYSGNLTTYHVRLDAGEVLMVQAMNRARAQGWAPTWEDRVWISWPAQAGVLVRD
ncbi:MAG: ABC transporter ATP-binding protein [Pseudomonadota bacterium]